MVESPKEPPNSDFGTSFSAPPPPKLDEQPNTSTAVTEGSVSDVSTTITSDANVVDLQEPIDVNTPRDTTNIFYAYEVTDANVSDPQITIEQSLPVEINQTNANLSQVNNQPSEQTADQMDVVVATADDVVVDIASAIDATTVNSDASRSSSSS